MKITIEIDNEFLLTDRQRHALAELVTDFQLSSEPTGTPLMPEPTPLGEFGGSVTEDLDVAVGGTSSDDEADERVRGDWEAPAPEFKVGDRVRLVELGDWPRSHKVFVGALGTVRKIGSTDPAPGHSDGVLLSLEMDDPDPAVMHSAGAFLGNRGWYVGTKHITKLDDEPPATIRRADVVLKLGDKVWTRSGISLTVSREREPSSAGETIVMNNGASYYANGYYFKNIRGGNDIGEVNGVAIVDDDVEG